MTFQYFHMQVGQQEARRLELKVKKDSRKMKVVNSKALPIVGIAKKASLKLGEWRGDVDSVVVHMDDFDVVLGMEFLLKHKVILMSLAQCMVVTSDTPSIVQSKIKQPSGVRMVSALQLKNGLSRKEFTFMAIPLVDEQVETGTVPVEIQRVMDK